MTEPLRVALAGLGTVGAGVIRLLDANGDLIARRAGRPIEIVAVSARDRSKDRGVDISRFDWIDDPAELARHAGADVVVELVGGSDGPALALARATLGAGKSFVTANKAMIAHHGLELARAAEGANVALKFEAAVAGGVPVIKGLREGAAANEIARVYGILNGTCNFILSKMEAEGRDFADILEEAQRLGYAEADPSFDIDGVDAAHKLSILASLAFGAQPHGLFQRVHPHLVPVSHPLAHVTGSTNAVVAEGNFVGRLLFQGAGAGDGPTASAVVADLIDIARGEFGPPYAMPASALAAQAAADSGERLGRAYVRFNVVDKVGVLAEIAAAMRDAGVSIESLIQRGTSADGHVLVAIVTHEGPERAVAQALEKLRGSQSLAGEPMWMHILGE
jgi:homoserine dehydrogenase